jgi:hypothetical protein
MHPLRTLILATAAASALLLAGPARAANPGVELGLGADWLLDPRVGAFQLTLGSDSHLNPHLSWGGRVGLLLLTDPGRVGVPIDLRLRGHFGAIYVDGLVGPWLIFRDGDALRFHAGVGFGLATRHLTIGLEVAYLNPTSMVGLRLAFPL